MTKEPLLMKQKKLIIWFLFPVLPVFLALADVSFNGAFLSADAFLWKAVLYAFLFMLSLFLSEKAFFVFKRSSPARHWHRFFTDSRINRLRFSVLFFAIYMGYLYAFRPGTCGYDTVNQILDLVTGMDPLPFDWLPWQENVSALMNDHHPVFTTLIFTAFYLIGVLLGNPNYGMFFYCLLQIACYALLFGYVICLMDRLKVPKLFALLSFFFFCSPVIAFYSFAMIKDSLFSLLFLIYYLVYFLVIRSALTGGELTHRNTVVLLLLSLAITLTNRKGIYVAFFSNLALLSLVSDYKSKLRILSCTVVPILFTVVLMGQLLFPLFRIYPGGRQEALGFAFQQTAGILIQDPDSFSEEEKDLFFRVIDMEPDTLKDHYNPLTTDGVKDYYNLSASNEDVTSFLKLWFSQIITHPLAALRIQLAVNGGFFAPVKVFDVYTDVVFYPVLDAFCQPEKTLHLREFLFALFEKTEWLPGISVLFRDAVYYFWLPIIASILILKHCRKSVIVCMVPIFTNIAFLLLGPVCWTRYGLCQLISFPVWASLPFIFSAEVSCLHFSRRI